MSGRKSASRVLTRAASRADEFRLDALDLKILRRYQKNTRTPAEGIAAEVGLSTAAVQRRLRKMRSSGVIEAEVAKISPAAVGLPITCIVSVELVRESANGIQKFKTRLARYPEVQQCYYVTGAADFILIVLARDMQAYEVFSNKALLDDSNVRSFSTNVVLDRVKTGIDVAINIVHGNAAIDS